MNAARRWLLGGYLFAICALAGPATVLANSPYAQWSNGPSTDPSYFPIGIWLQAPRPERVTPYAEAGFNLYMAISWDETLAGMERLRAAGMRVFLPQDDFALSIIDDPIIAGWLQQDEPDNAQYNGYGGYYSPVPAFAGTWWNTNPSSVKPMYDRFLNMQAVDDTRPVYLNLGQGVAWDDWVGRGVRTNHPEDYEDYAQCGDIISFDIYPAASSHSAVHGKLEMVPFGVDRLKAVTNSNQVVWNCMECTNISGNGKATPEEVRTEVWMSLIHGSMGLVYFGHVISPDFDEMGLLHDPEMLAAVGKINNEIHSVAPALNSPSLDNEAYVTKTPLNAPLDMMVKRANGNIYIFSVMMEPTGCSAQFYAPNAPEVANVEVIGEDRTIPAYGGWFSDTFTPYQTHLYRISAQLPGDADSDGDVDLQDFVIFKANFGISTGAIWAQGDFDADGDVDLQDFVILKTNFGATQ